MDDRFEKLLHEMLAVRQRAAFLASVEEDEDAGFAAACGFLVCRIETILKQTGFERELADFDIENKSLLVSSGVSSSQSDAGSNSAQSVS